MRKTNIMKISVFCASSAKVNPAYFRATESLAKILVKNNIEVVYGGGSVGLMGRLADTMLLEGGNICGVMPKFMKDKEMAHPDVPNMIFTETLHERKAKLLEGIDGLIALPGGSGTLEELLEAITLKRLGQFNKPIIILNTDGFYSPLQAMLEKCVWEHFMEERHLQMWKMVAEPEEVLFALKNPKPWSAEAISFATNT